MPTLGAEPPSGEGARFGDDRGLTLEDLLAEESFRLELVAGGDEQLRRHVLGAQSVEDSVAAAMLVEDWIVLTTGAELAGDPGAQQRLMAALDEAGAAALG